MGIELALNDLRAGRGGDEEIGIVVARTADAADGVTRRRKDVGDEPLVVHAGVDGGEIVGGCSLALSISATKTAAHFTPSRP